MAVPDGQMLDKYEAEYALLISDNENEMFKNADFYYNPLICFEGKSKTSDFNDIRFLNLPEELQIHSIFYSIRNKKPLVLIFNNSNKKIETELHLKCKNIYEVNLTEKRISDENLKNKTVTFEPKALKLFSFTNNKEI